MREEVTIRVGQRNKNRSPIGQNFRFSPALPNYVTVNVNIKQLFVQTSYAYIGVNQAPRTRCIWRTGLRSENVV